MAQNKVALKRRIRSVRATKKITNAMELIATSKLQKQKQKMELNRVYANTLFHTFNRVLGSANIQEIPYLTEREGKTLTLVFVSDMGLCGGYNSNILSKIKETISNDNPLFVVGSKGRYWLNKNNYTLFGELETGDNLTYGHIAKVATKIMDAYLSGEITKLQVLYTKFVNTMTFQPTLMTLLPITEEVMPTTVDVKVEDVLQQDIIFEPDAVTLINQLVPMFIQSLLYSLWLESKTSEHAARRMAMDNATDNAEELIEDLVLKYNQSRQSAITQEITEIVAGAEAL
ncbi:MAG TPA: ATP synthase F1 subunit gamma [Erysipelotrichaceae bacterium]|nr:ATP synthase F1 subunit gamma [Erysipelotrichaceae bacterium]